MTARDVFERELVTDENGNKKARNRGWEITDVVSVVLAERFRMRRMAYREIALFEQEDLEQEVWARFIESGFDGDIPLYERESYRIAEALARRGRRRRKIGRTVVFSDLGRNDREVEAYINKHAVRVFR